MPMLATDVYMWYSWWQSGLEACVDVGVELAGLDECLRSWIGEETRKEVEEEADDK